MDTDPNREQSPALGFRPSAFDSPLDHQPSTINHQPTRGRRSGKRNGKVARLPDYIREVINHLLNDGVGYRQIIQKLNLVFTLPYPLSEMNLSNWYHGGFQDWLQTRLSAKAGASRPHPATSSQFPNGLVHPAS